MEIVKLARIRGSSNELGFHSVISNNIKIIHLSEIRGNVSQVQLSRIIGHVTPIVQDDFFSLVGNKFKTGLRKLDNTHAQIIFIFNTETEANNFIGYLMTDFARLCISIIKVNQGVGVTELLYIPWLDFTQEWTDEKLFEHFSIDKQTINYINSFIPDYY